MSLLGDSLSLHSKSKHSCFTSKNFGPVKVSRIYSETRLYKIRRESQNEFEITEVYHNRGCLTRKSPSSYPKEFNFGLQYIRVFTITEFYITEFHCNYLK